MIGAVLWENGFSLKEIGVATMVLFAVIDIFGTIPVIIALKEKTGQIFPLRTAAVALFILSWIPICRREYFRANRCRH